MTLDAVAFWLVAILSLTGAAGMVFARKPVYAVLNMALVFFALGLGYVFLQCSFLGAAQIIIYSGAVLVVFLYIAMLIAPGNEERAGSRASRYVTYALSAVLAAILWKVMQPAGARQFIQLDGYGDARHLGAELITGQVMSFELASVLLVAALVGAVVPGKRSVE